MKMKIRKELSKRENKRLKRNRRGRKGKEEGRPR